MSHGRRANKKRKEVKKLYASEFPFQDTYGYVEKRAKLINGYNIFTLKASVDNKVNNSVETMLLASAIRTHCYKCKFELIF